MIHPKGKMGGVEIFSIFSQKRKVVFREFLFFWNHGVYTESFLRPFLLRLSTTFLPVALLLRTRNPWVFFLFFLLGAYVFDIILSITKISEQSGCVFSFAGSVPLLQDTYKHLVHILLTYGMVFNKFS